MKGSVIKVKLMGDEKQIKKQLDSNKLTARERVDLFFDEGTFQEVQFFVKMIDEDSLN
jgi:acetyl-CoA carboxylase carboxyltransferase component